MPSAVSPLKVAPFRPCPRGLEDFVVLRGSELLTSDRYPFLGEFTAEFLPLLHASAIPGGPVSDAAYAQLKGEFLDRLQAALPVDGLYLDLHGAMAVTGLEDAELDWVQAARSVVGPECLIAASMDLHGNVSRAFAQSVDMLTAYRTAPHVDILATRRKAVAMLITCLQRGQRPHVAHLWVPLALPGERTSTAAEPAASLYAGLAVVDQVPGVLDASIFVGYVWADQARTGAAVTVSGFDPATAAQEAARLAQRYWDVRRQFTFAVPAASMDDCIHQALAASAATVFISDAGDNPTAGAVGDVPYSLARLLELDVPDAVLAAIPDAQAVAACQAAGVGQTVRFGLGGRLDARHGPPLTVQGQVMRLVQGDAVAGSQAVLKVGGVQVILTERRKPFTTVADFAQVGIDPLAHKIVVVKLGYLFPELAAIAPLAFIALTPGASDLDIPRLPFHVIRRPIYPLDSEMAWQAHSDAHD